MIDTYKQLIKSQYEATLCTLGICVDKCPEQSWDAPVANWKFCQVSFHVLFFTDMYLEGNLAGFRAQAYHREHADVFRDYEELEDHPPTLTYSKASITDYLHFCRDKSQRTLDAETVETLQSRSRFEWIEATRAEAHLYNIRHIQHHAAQLILRLRLDADIDVPWVKHGWVASG